MGGRPAPPWYILTAVKSAGRLSGPRNLVYAKSVLISERRGFPAPALSHRKSVR
jgi:hypothetical protein